MTVTVERMASLIGADINEDLTEIESTLEQAVLMVENYTGGCEVPESIMDLAVTRVAGVLWSNATMPGRTADNFYETSDAPSPVNRDPMGTAYVILRKWVLPW